MLQNSVEGEATGTAKKGGQFLVVMKEGGEGNAYDRSYLETAGGTFRRFATSQAAFAVARYVKGLGIAELGEEGRDGLLLIKNTQTLPAEPLGRVKHGTGLAAAANHSVQLTRAEVGYRLEKNGYVSYAKKVGSRYELEDDQGRIRANDLTSLERVVHSFASMVDGNDWAKEQGVDRSVYGADDPANEPGLEGRPFGRKANAEPAPVYDADEPVNKTYFAVFTDGVAGDETGRRDLFQTDRPNNWAVVRDQVYAALAAYAVELRRDGYYVCPIQKSFLLAEKTGYDGRKAYKVMKVYYRETGEPLGDGTSDPKTDQAPALEGRPVVDNRPNVGEDPPVVPVVARKDITTAVADFRQKVEDEAQAKGYAGQPFVCPKHGDQYVKETKEARQERLKAERAQAEQAAAERAKEEATQAAERARKNQPAPADLVAATVELMNEAVTYGAQVGVAAEAHIAIVTKPDATLGLVEDWYADYRRRVLPVVEGLALFAQAKEVVAAQGLPVPEPAQLTPDVDLGNAFYEVANLAWRRGKLTGPFFAALRNGVASPLIQADDVRQTWAWVASL